MKPSKQTRLYLYPTTPTLTITSRDCYCSLNSCMVPFYQRCKGMPSRLGWLNILRHPYSYVIIDTGGCPNTSPWSWSPQRADTEMIPLALAAAAHAQLCLLKRISVGCAWTLRSSPALRKKYSAQPPFWVVCNRGNHSFEPPSPQTNCKH